MALKHGSPGRSRLVPAGYSFQTVFVTIGDSDVHGCHSIFLEEALALKVVNQMVVSVWNYHSEASWKL